MTFDALWKLVVTGIAVLLLTIVMLSTTACAPIKEFGDGVGRTVDKLVHPREW